MVTQAPSPPPATPIDRYVFAAREAGVPREQFLNFARAGIVLHPKQLRASAVARSCDLAGGPVDLGYGGARGGGKSYWGLAQVAADDCQRFPGLKCLFLRKVGKAGKESFEDLRRRVLGRIPHKYTRHPAGLLQFPNDSRIVLGHYQNESDIDAYLGLEYDVILTEEATTLTAKKYRYVSTCNRSSKSGWRPRQYNTTNPGGVGHQWYRKLFVDPYQRRREQETRFVPATADDNPSLNPEYVRTKLDTLTGWQLKAWRYGDWDIAAGQYFTTFRREWNDRGHHVVPWFQLPRGWRVWGALDYGFVHFTVFYLLAQDGDGNVFLMDEHGERGWLPGRHAPAIHALLARNGVEADQLERIAAGGDVFNRSRGTTEESPLTIADTYRELGLPLTAANDDRVQGAAEILKRLGDVEADPPIGPRLFITERCGRLIDCLPSLEHDPHYPEKVLKTNFD